jgi:zinc/manganese transport system substrate-binding protein
VVGALLVASLFVVPAATARLFTDRVRSWQLASVALVALEGTAGLWLSVETNAPPGATIACVAGGTFAVAALVRAALARLPRRAPVLAGTALTLVLLAAGCGGSGSSDGRLEVVATTTHIGDWVRAVGGEEVAVHQVLQPNTDPHDYEPRPSDVQAAAGAGLVFASGDDLDHWIEEIVADSGGEAPVVDLSATVADPLSDDPHWWHDPRNVEAAVLEISARLQEADPSHRRLYQRNADAYLGRLAQLDAGIARCLGSVPRAQRKLVTDHDAFGYFARRYDIEVVGAVIPAQAAQAQPSAQDVDELAELVDREEVKAIFPESSLSSKVAEAIARQTGASTEFSLYGDSLGPAGSEGGTYLGMEAANAEAMVRGFTGGERGCNLSP